MKKKVTKKQTKPKVTETKAQKFSRLANYRLQKVLKDLANLSKLSNKAYYDYDISQIERINQNVQRQLNDCIEMFLKGGKSTADYTL